MSSVTSKKPSAVQSVWNTLAGVAADFWEDGPSPAFWVDFKAQVQSMVAGKSVSKPAARPRERTYRTDTGVWSATYPEILSKLWGEGHCLPGGNAMIESLVASMELNGEMNVLDLSAGTGAAGRCLALARGTYVTGLETDVNLVEYGKILTQNMELAQKVSLDVYIPTLFEPDKLYSCVMARELFYHIPNKGKFFNQISKSLHPKGQPRGQLVFTDYMLEGADKKKPAVAAWLAEEKEASPISLAETIKLFSKAGIDVRVTEDLTEKYRNDVLRALANFAGFLQKEPPKRDTKLLVLNELKKWALRVSAMKQGLKVYRCYAIKA